jgi:hypothetical protein
LLSAKFIISQCTMSVTINSTLHFEFFFKINFGYHKFVSINKNKNVGCVSKNKFKPVRLALNDVRKMSTGLVEKKLTESIDVIFKLQISRKRRSKNLNIISQQFTQ